MQTMTTKENWDEAHEHLAAFWTCRYIDRPLMLVTAPNADAREKPAEPADHRTKWTDIDYLCALDEWHAASTHWLADSIPSRSVWNLGWCQNYGFPITFAKDTIWLDPVLTEWREVDWNVRWRDAWWDRAVEYTAKACERARGRYFVGAIGPLPPNDHLSLLRGAGSFLLDLVDHSAEVKKAQRAMTAIGLTMQRELYSIRKKHFDGNVAHYPVWCPGYVGLWQSDVSAMISPDMYREFILPELRMAADEFDHMIYHLDGPDAIKHVDAICAVEKIRLIQWMPGAGQPYGIHWLDLYRKIQAHGKAVLIYCQPAEIESLIRELDPALMVLQCGVATKAEGLAVIEAARNCTRRYHSRPGGRRPQAGE